MREHPEMVRWKQFDIAEFASNQNLRLGDLTGDGNKELAFIQGSTSPLQVSAISVMNLEGEMMWQYGNLGPVEPGSGEELPVQIHDLDGDGARDVIFVSQGVIHILDGRSGELVRQKNLGASWRVRSMVFADLLGIGRASCMLLSDRSNNLLVLNDQLDNFEKFMN